MCSGKAFSLQNCTIQTDRLTAFSQNVYCFQFILFWGEKKSFAIVFKQKFTFQQLSILCNKILSNSEITLLEWKFHLLTSQFIVGSKPKASLWF